MFKFKHAILGGTFDRFHAGHKLFVDRAFEQAERVSVGISLPELYENKTLSEEIEPYEIRENYVKKYIREKGYADRVKIIALSDIYGTSLQDSTIDSIVATEETLENVQKVNNRRNEIGFLPMEIINVGIVNADDGIPITSARIRLGQIDRNGISYQNFFYQKDRYILPTSLREELRKSPDKIFGSVEDAKDLLDQTKLIIAVGDIIAMELIKKGYKSAITIIDTRTRREEIDKKIIDEFFPKVNFKINNPPGTINKEILDIYNMAIKAYYSSTQVVVVNGEEDLLALPMILFSPLGSIVLYGQMDEGISLIQISEETKKYAKQILSQF